MRGYCPVERKKRSPETEKHKKEKRREIDRMEQVQITQWCRRFIEEQVQEGDWCIDATAGNGNDTELLCRLVGEAGRVWAFDIQEQAIEATRKRLAEKGLSDRARLILGSHAEMERYIEGAEGRISCIVFNFGYLPGGDHSVATQADTSVKAIQQGLRLLKKGGLMSLCIYSGGDSGFTERDVLLDDLKQLDPKQYLVIVSEYYNRPNHPPLPVLVIRL